MGKMLPLVQQANPSMQLSCSHVMLLMCLGQSCLPWLGHALRASPLRPPNPPPPQMLFGGVGTKNHTHSSSLFLLFIRRRGNFHPVHPTHPQPTGRRAGHRCTLFPSLWPACSHPLPLSLFIFPFFFLSLVLFSTACSPTAHPFGSTVRHGGCNRPARWRWMRPARHWRCRACGARAGGGGRRRKVEAANGARGRHRWLARGGGRPCAGGVAAPGAPRAKAADGGARRRA
jgi:hypothetical protein